MFAAIRHMLSRPAGADQHQVSIVYSIQYLRALAACLIVFHHAMAPSVLAPYYQSHLAAFGVDLFFVISGYIMWTTTEHSERGTLVFWRARIFRVLPLYWIFTSLYICVLLVMPSALFSAPTLNLGLVLASYLFVPTSVPVYSLGWTLNYEMYFYFIFGLCLLIPSRRVRLATLAGILFSLVIAGYAWSPQQSILVTYTNPLLLEFLAGTLIAASQNLLRQISRSLAAFLILVGSLLIGHYALGGGSLTNRHLTFGIPAALIVAGAVGLESMVRSRPNRLLKLLGDASYSIYLAHPFALRFWYFALGPLLMRPAAPTNAILYVAGAIVVGTFGGIASYLLLERPLLTAGRKLIKRRTERVPRYG